ncbi:hypothetical protein [Pseudomonas bohemica]|uniref:hypothetical protein n=1 Tax=Pseudomonas bohemica TaxID=2044872 RepID=UPI001F1D949A|nr:hypothetical protein [Pseudomonas bohemica]
MTIVSATPQKAREQYARLGRFDERFALEFVDATALRRGLASSRNRSVHGRSDSQPSPCAAPICQAWPGAQRIWVCNMYTKAPGW